MKPTFAFLAAFFGTLAGAQQRRCECGIQAAVARQLGVTEGHVSLVAAGKRKSARVETALRVARLEREAA